MRLHDPQLDSASEIHSFESVFAVAGSVVNQDASISAVHETTKAKGFFHLRCSADTDAIQGHLKAHT